MKRSPVAVLFLVALILAPNRASGAALAPSPERQATAHEKWDQDIAALEALDQREQHPDNSILVVGSSSIRRWATITTDLAPYHPIRRGFGGSKYSDVAVFAERLVAPHTFQALVVFVGNDVTGKPEDATPEEVAGWFEHWVTVTRNAQPNAAIFCIEIFPTPSRWEVWPRIREVNGALARSCAALPNVYYIPTAHGFLGPDGQPQPDLYGEDRLHLNDLGYRIWSAVIKSHLDAWLEAPCSDPGR